MPLLSIAENIFLGNEPQRFGVIDWAEAHAPHARAAGQGGPGGIAGHAGHQPRRRQAAAGGDRQGAGQARAAADPGRADREPERARQRRRCWTCCSSSGAGHRLILISHKLNEISRVADSHHRAARRLARCESLDCRAEAVSEDHIIRAMVGRELADRYPPRTRSRPRRRDGVRGARLARRASGARRPRGGQGRRPQGQARRDRRHRRA